MRQQLKQINAMRQAVRTCLAQFGLMEVVTPISTLMPGGETHLDALPVEFQSIHGSKAVLYLRTSPEVWHKKLLAQGSGPIFELAPCVRDGEGGRWHDLEFEMVEWYRPHGHFDDLVADVEALLECTYGLNNKVRPATIRTTVQQLFEQHVGCVLDPSLPLTDFKRELSRCGINCADDDTWDDAFFRAWVSRVEPELTNQGTVVIERYPASQAAMAKLCSDDSRFCERFEVYVEGVELANAFNELTDGQEQRKRFEQWQNERQRLGKKSFPKDETFFDAVDQLPPTVGIALGLDRLMALALGSTSLTAVRPFKLDDLLETH